MGGREMEAAVKVRMLGELVISGELGQITDTQNRSKKVWTLLAFLLYNHGRVVSQSELMDLLWYGDKDGANPASALKTTLHRARALLDQVSPAGGHKLLLNKNGGYTWNAEIPLELDTEEFERLCRGTSEPETDGGLARCRQALSLYRGLFLNRLSSESWVIPLGTYYHNIYMSTVERTLELMETHGLRLEAEELCRAAIHLDPYQENLYQHLMRVLLATGQQSQAVTVFEDMSKLLLSNFGVMPDQESRRLYREALRTVNRRTVTMGTIREQLQESDPITGALVCDYDFFKMIYQAEARMMARSGTAAHIVLFSLDGIRGKELSKRSLEVAMDNMEELLRTSLRKGDVLCRCSPSQFLIMLPLANFENSGMVCRRIESAFARKYPHSPAVVQYMVCPLEPVADMGYQK